MNQLKSEIQSFLLITINLLDVKNFYRFINKDKTFSVFVSFLLKRQFTYSENLSYFSPVSHHFCPRLSPHVDFHHQLFYLFIYFFPQVNKQQLQAVKERFMAFLNGETQIVADEAFCNAVRSYHEVKMIFFLM